MKMGYKEKDIPNYKQRSIANYEVESLLLYKFSQLEFENVYRVISTLGDYMILDTNMLKQIHFQRYNENLSIKYLKTAVHEKLIAEFKFGHKTEFEKEIYFYTPQGSALSALKKEGCKYNRLPLATFAAGKSRVVTANQYFLNHSYVPNLAFPLPMDKNLNFFYATNAQKQRIVCYFSDFTSPSCITEYFLSFKKGESVLKNITFEVIDLEMIDFGIYTRATHPNLAASSS
jgi:hypothetical protein